MQDPVVHNFFAEQYAIWDEDYRSNAIEPVLNKVETLLASPVLRAMIGSTASSINFADIMDNRKVLIANLSKGAIGEGHAHLLGALLVSGFLHAAMARGVRASPTAPPPLRVPFYLFVDEFQNFATDSFGEIASEARKMKLGLLLAHQYLRQASPELSAAILGNVGTIIAFQLGAVDAKAIGPEIGLKEPEWLTTLSRHEVWLKHATYGGPTHPHLLPPIETRATGREPALKQNRLRNTFPRARVEAKIERFLRPHQDIPAAQRERAPDPWPRSLRVLRRALAKGLKEHGQPISQGGKAVTAVDIQIVKQNFSDLVVAHGQSAEDRTAEKGRDFKKVIRGAQEHRLIGAIELDGTQWVYIDQ